jgi:SAM-dependent methyltransferase
MQTSFLRADPQHLPRMPQGNRREDPVAWQQGLHGKTLPGMRAVRGAHLRRCGLSSRVRFIVGAAETLPFPSESFDAPLCECAFCTFSDKERAASEFARILRPGGLVGMSDLTRTADPLPG